MSRRTRRSSPHRSYRSWPDTRPIARSCGPAWDRRSAPRCRLGAAPRLGHLVLTKPGDQLALTLCCTRAGLPQHERTNACIHLGLGHIDANDNGINLCHHPLPSLLGSGSKPLQLFALRKTPELSLALSQALSPLGATGSVPATGGFNPTARSHILTDFLDTRAQGKPGVLCTRSLACEKNKAHEQVTTGSPKQSGLPCAMVLTAYL